MDAPDVVRSTAIPGIMVFCVPATPPGSVGIRWMAVQVEPFVEVVYTRSFLAHPDRKRRGGVLWRPVQFLSRFWVPVATATLFGLFQVAPPFVGRRSVTAAPFRLASSASPETIQTLCRASNATDGSLTRAYGPGGVEL